MSQKQDANDVAANYGAEAFNKLADMVMAKIRSAPVNPDVAAKIPKYGDEQAEPEKEKPDNFIRFSDMFSKIHTDYAPQPRIKTGIVTIDKLTYSGRDDDGGFVYGSLNTIFASTGKGKSTLGSNIARMAANTGVHTGLITLEDSPSLTLIKLAAQQAAVPIEAANRFARKLPIHKEQHDAIVEQGNLLSEIPLFINHIDNAMENIEKILAKHRANGMQLCVIDQSSWISVQDVTNPFELANTISSRLTAIARNTGMVIIILVQANREGSKQQTEEKKALTLHNIKDSARFAADSDIVLCIQDVQKFDKAPHSMRIDILKSRQSIFPMYAHLDYWPEIGLVKDSADTTCFLSADAQPTTLKTNPSDAIINSEFDFAKKFASDQYVEWILINEEALKSGIKQKRIDELKKLCLAKKLIHEHIVKSRRGNTYLYSTLAAPPASA